MLLFYVSLCSKSCGFQCNIRGNQHCKGGGEGGEEWHCIVGAAALIERGGRVGRRPASFVKIFWRTVHIYCSILCHSLVFIAQDEMISVIMYGNGFIYFVVC